jgi:hypothetical protein
VRRATEAQRTGGLTPRRSPFVFSDYP